MKELLETWQINNNINLYLLSAIDEEQLRSVPASKGRTVAEQWVHLHNVRLMWIQASDPHLLSSVQKLEKGTTVTKDVLKEALSKSSVSIMQVLEKGCAEGKIKGFKPHPTAFLGYLISHESHHRGQIMLTLKLAGHPVDKKTSYGLWEWSSR